MLLFAYKVAFALLNLVKDRWKPIRGRVSGYDLYQGKCAAEDLFAADGLIHQRGHLLLAQFSQELRPCYQAPDFCLKHVYEHAQHEQVNFLWHV